MYRILAKATALLFLANVVASAQQMADPDFKTTVERPAHARRHPRVVVDEAHENFHTADGRYKPFAELLRSDGCEVVAGKEKFSRESLKSVDMLVIANAATADATDDTSGPAFTEAECDAVRDWVRGGGSLLLVADHTPFGSAAASLGARFGVDMGKGFVFDEANSEGNETMLVFSRGNRLLGSHAILKGRDSSEEVKRVMAFTGQSLGVPKGATVLFRLGPAAREAARRGDLGTGAATARPVGGRAQGLAMRFGKGRVVVLGEAAMLSAQVVRMPQSEFKMGMNVPGTDDRQFALNVERWLTGALK